MTETRTAQATGWVGWIAFAGIMLMIIGGLQAIYGLVAVLNDEWVLWGNGNAVVIDITAWGWIHLIIGIVVILAGIGVLLGNMLARIVGVAVAAVSLIASFMALPLYPVWSLIVITLDVLVIWALVAHGGEMKRV
ncbi:MAG TPA: hypothetical protein VIY72_09740 [Acidimicrobiales bacterium]